MLRVTFYIRPGSSIATEYRHESFFPHRPLIWHFSIDF